MGSLWQPLNWTIVGHHNINFFIAYDPYEDNLKRKSIVFAGLLKLKFWFLGRSTITPSRLNRLKYGPKIW